MTVGASVIDARTSRRVRFKARFGAMPRQRHPDDEPASRPELGNRFTAVPPRHRLHDGGRVRTKVIKGQIPKAFGATRFLIRPCSGRRYPLVPKWGSS